MRLCNRQQQSFQEPHWCWVWGRVLNRKWDFNGIKKGKTIRKNTSFKSRAFKKLLVGDIKKGSIGLWTNWWEKQKISKQSSEVPTIVAATKDLAECRTQLDQLSGMPEFQFHAPTPFLWWSTAKIPRNGSSKAYINDERVQDERWRALWCVLKALALLSESTSAKSS